MSKTIEIAGHADESIISDKIDTAIARSASHTEIVHVYVEADSANEARSELERVADDSTVTVDSDGRPLVDAWGTDDEGTEWRVHLHLRGEQESAERRSDRSCV